MAYLVRVKEDFIVLAQLELASGRMSRISKTYLRYLLKLAPW
jgi:hypothetical protein